MVSEPSEDSALAALAAAVADVLGRQQRHLATAESCTGGWVAQVVTHTAGSSDWFDRGFITYSNDAKRLQLGVSTATLADCGAVSQETAEAMALGALKQSRGDISLAITGIAGPTGGSPGKPVGTVCFAWCQRDQAAQSSTCHFDGDREAVRRLSVVYALEQLLEKMGARTVP